MPKVFTVQVPYHGYVIVDIIADSEKEALDNDMIDSALDEQQPDLEDPEYENMEAESVEVRDLTPEEMKEWLASEQAKLEADKPSAA